MRPKFTLRTRLTLVYGTLFLVAGLVMLALTWALVQQQVLIAGPEFPVGTDVPRTVERAPAPDEDVVIRAVDATREAALSALVTQGTLALVLVGGLAAWIGWLLAGRMLHPLAMMTATARRIAEAPDADRRMHERIAIEGPRDEITELADTFDGMLARLDAAFDGQRRFIANASHELRTPLTLNRALLEVSTSRADASADLKLLSETLLQINARHEHLIDGLLLLARSERELAERRFVDLADVVEHVVGRPWTDETVELEIDTTEAPTIGDPVLLEQLVRNLVDNGVRHNLVEGGFVRVATRTDSTSAVLEVSNSGPVIAPYELDDLVEPFHRLRGDRMADTDGAGLGLSIVRAIVQAHDGELQLSARADGGLGVTVRLPVEPYQPDDEKNREKVRGGSAGEDEPNIRNDPSIER